MCKALPPTTFSSDLITIAVIKFLYLGRSIRIFDRYRKMWFATNRLPETFSSLSVVSPNYLRFSSSEIISA